MSYQKEYIEFFENTNAGVHYLEALKDLITSKYEQAEKNPDQARDLTQQARGIREAINHVLSTTAEGGKKKRTE